MIDVVRRAGRQRGEFLRAKPPQRAWLVAGAVLAASRPARAGIAADLARHPDAWIDADEDADTAPQAAQLPPRMRSRLPRLVGGVSVLP